MYEEGEGCLNSGLLGGPLFTQCSTGNGELCW